MMLIFGFGYVGCFGDVWDFGVCVEYVVFGYELFYVNVYC